MLKAEHPRRQSVDLELHRTIRKNRGKEIKGDNFVKLLKQKPQSDLDKSSSKSFKAHIFHSKLIKIKQYKTKPRAARNAIIS